MTQKQKIQSPHAPAAIGPYSQAIRIGSFLYTSGQIPLDPSSGEMVSGGVREQTRRVLLSLKAVLEQGGASLETLIKTTVFVTDLSQFVVLNEEYEAFFKEFAPDVPAPARSTVEVSALPKGSQVEIEGIAWVQAP